MLTMLDKSEIYTGQNLLVLSFHDHRTDGPFDIGCVCVAGWVGVVVLRGRGPIRWFLITWHRCTI